MTLSYRINNSRRHFGFGVELKNFFISDWLNTGFYNPSTLTVNSRFLVRYFLNVLHDSTGVKDGIDSHVIFGLVLHGSPAGLSEENVGTIFLC